MTDHKAADPASLDALRERFTNLCVLCAWDDPWVAFGRDAIAAIEAAKPAVPSVDALLTEAADEYERLCRAFDSDRSAHAGRAFRFMSKIIDAIASLEAERAGGREAVAWLVRDGVGMWKVAWDGGNTHGAIPVYAASPAQEWRTIESAPRGQRIIAAVYVHSEPTDEWEWECHEVSFDDETGVVEPYQGWDSNDYTHWMPLPEPPK